MGGAVRLHRGCDGGVEGRGPDQVDGPVTLQDLEDGGLDPSEVQVDVVGMLVAAWALSSWLASTS
jgi:hypothetical protein